MSTIKNELQPYAGMYETIRERQYVIKRTFLSFFHYEYVARTEHIGSTLSLNIETQQPPDFVVINGVEYVPK